jgi:hypothetical protein
MRIIKEGQKPIEEWQVACKKCGCIFYFDRRDILYGQRDGDCVICPTCNEYIGIKLGYDDNVKK